ncbi:MAG TPA: hypothetical protein PK566_18375, partial [Pseudobacteroides sp.]|nr:hypothetical protein [Pseudobacteroides sp.]
MKKVKVFFIPICIILLLSAKLICAEGQVSSMPMAKPASSVSPESSGTPTSSSTPTSSDTPRPSGTPVSNGKATLSDTPTPLATPTNVQPTIDIYTISIPGITDNPLYKELLDKKASKDKLTEEENKLCKEIREQEEKNKKLALNIINKSKSYNEPYRKIIDEIKALLNPVKRQKILDLTKAAQSSSTGESIDMADLNKRVELYSNQIAGLNNAIKGMRDSMKYISMESVAYNQKLKAVQKSIDTLNDEIAKLNKAIIEDKMTKEIEWTNFCIYMNNNDVASALKTYGNVIVLKERIVNNYKEILIPLHKLFFYNRCTLTT